MDFTDFDQSDVAWDRLQAWWRFMFEHMDPQGDWEAPWLTEERDGNPLFTAWLPRQRRGIRVIHFAPVEGQEDFSHWFDTFAAGQPEQTSELVVSCAPTAANLLRAKDLVRAWIAGWQGRPVEVAAGDAVMLDAA